MKKQFPRQESRTLKVKWSDDNTDYLAFPFSSEQPVERWWGIEILSHEPGSVNLSRAEGMNLLWNHNRNKVLGVIESIEIKADRRGYCLVRWSKRKEIEPFKQDVADGILRNVSFAYQIDSISEKAENEYVCSWTPLEISLVSVPADHTVGIGRAMSESNLKNNSKGEIMSETPGKYEVPFNREDEIKRIRSIQELSNQWGHQDLADQLIADGASIEEARSEYLGKISQNQTPVAKPVNPLGLSDKEEKSYSILRAIQASISGDWSKAGFERECSVELSKRSGKSPAANSFLMPVRDLKIPSTGQRATYAVGGDPTGGYTVQTELLAENFIDALRNRAVIFSLGAQMLSGLQGNIDIPGQDGVSTTYWVSEGGAVTQSEATFRQVQLRPKTIGTLSRYTRLTLMQSSIDIEQFIRRDFAAQIALGIDLAAIAGTGLSNQPTGILNTPGIGSVAIGATGGAPTWDHIVNLETEVAVDNADINSCHYLTNAKVRGKLKRTEKFTGTNGNPIWETMGQSNYLNGYMAHVSNQVPSNLTKSTGSNLSAMIYGDFSSLICGEWGVLEVLVNPYGDTDYPAGTVAIRALQTIDIAVRYAQSFAAITDIVTT